ncbi:T9SS type A sorting domain-containing protein [Flavobacteriaceae bacterium]|nr:T9SS type A sorting domain-containing protein [Flavobacteriaceae bacterium]MDB4559609.1 T9SS type A sorting domain-containing protein [Flavobacteriaceae bacterium]
MTKKITQNSMKTIVYSCFMAFTFLFSLTISSQEVGDEFLVNPGINTATGANTTTPDTGVDGSGNFPVLGGWGTGFGGAYAAPSTVNGDCHSNDRMFKLFKVGNANGQYVTQTVTLPAGNYNWSFWTKWGQLVSWDNTGDSTPKFTILTDDNNDSTWEAVQTVITTQPTTVDTWVEQTGTYTNEIERQVRIKFSKFGGTSASPSNLNQLWFIDDVSLNFASGLGNITDDTSLSDLTVDGTTISGFSPLETNYDVYLPEGTTTVPTVVATTTDVDATNVITDATSLPGTTSILITAEDGTTTSTVTVNFVAVEAGLEFLVNGGVNTTAVDPDTGVDGSGNFPVLGGWGAGVGGSYAPTSAANGDCYSEDRMFKLFKKGNADGQFINQTITLPAGTYNWSFWTRWAALVSWGNTGDYEPTFKIMTNDDNDNTWETVQTVVTTQPTTANEWMQQTGTFTNDIERKVRIKFSKYGGTTAEPSNLSELWFIDEVSLNFASSLSVSEQELMSLSIYPNPTSDMISIKGVENIKSIKVYSILGALEKEVFNTNQIDVSELSPGVHLIKIDNGTIYSKKIIKQ